MPLSYHNIHDLEIFVPHVFAFLFQSTELTEIDAARNWPGKGGCIPKTWRFDPLTSQTSGLFVAKFTKIFI